MIHSFSVALRHQIRCSPVRVFEVIPPVMDTEFDRGLFPVQTAAEIVDGIR